MRRFKVVEMGKIWCPEEYDILCVGMIFDIETLRSGFHEPCPVDFDGTVEELNQFFSEENEGGWYIVWEEVFDEEDN